MKAPMNYLLTGKLFCGHCGGSMVGESGTSGSGTIYNYYKCLSRKRHKDCTKQTEKKDWIEKLVVEETVKRILQPEVIDEIACKVAELAENEFNNKSRLTTVQNDLKSVQTAIRNLLRLVEQGIDTDELTSPQEMAEHIVKMAREKGSCDDISAVVIGNIRKAS